MGSKSFVRWVVCLSVVAFAIFAFANPNARVESRSGEEDRAIDAAFAEAESALAKVRDSNPAPELSTVAVGHNREGFAGLRLFQNPPASTAGQAGEKTVDQTRKNIQVLKGLPDTQLIPVMNLMSASLGVNCAFCHVNTGGDFDFAKDDKEEKGVARHMIQMVFDTNSKFFNGRHAISCYTCHRGKENPVGVPVLPVVATEPRRGGPQGGGDQPRPTNPTADQIIAKYVAAVGGQAAIDKQKSRVSKGVQILGNGTSIPIEIYQEAPDKYYAVARTAQNGEMVTVYTSGGGWAQSARGREQLSGDQLELLKRTANFYSVGRLSELYPKPRVGRDKIGEHAVYVLTSQISERTIARLYFDAESGLLLRMVTLMDTPIGRIPQETDYEDYRDVGGVKMPFTVKVLTVDGRSGYTRKFSEINADVPVDESKFAAPASTK